MIIQKYLNEKRRKFEFTEIENELKNRSDIFGASHEIVGEKEEFSSDENRRRFSATEAFIETAMFHLTKRAREYQRNAWSLLWLAVFVAIGFVLLAYRDLNPEEISKLSGLEWKAISVILIAKLTIGSVFVAGIVIPTNLARSFFHEAAVLYSRRHALRFGRYYVRLNNAENINGEELRQMFNWNHQTDSAFARKVGDKEVQTALSAVTTVLESITNAVSAMKKPTD